MFLSRIINSELRFEVIRHYVAASKVQIDILLNSGNLQVGAFLLRCQVAGVVLVPEMNGIV